MSLAMAHAEALQARANVYTWSYSGCAYLDLSAVASVQTPSLNYPGACRTQCQSQQYAYAGLIAG